MIEKKPNIIKLYDPQHFKDLETYKKLKKGMTVDFENIFYKITGVIYDYERDIFIYEAEDTDTLD